MNNYFGKLSGFVNEILLYRLLSCISIYIKVALHLRRTFPGNCEIDGELCTRAYLELLIRRKTWRYLNGRKCTRIQNLSAGGWRIFVLHFTATNKTYATVFYKLLEMRTKLPDRILCSLVLTLLLWLVVHQFHTVICMLISSSFKHII